MPNPELTHQLAAAPDPAFDAHWEQILTHSPDLAGDDAEILLKREQFRRNLKIAFAAGRVATLEQLTGDN